MFERGLTLTLPQKLLFITILRQLWIEPTQILNWQRVVDQSQILVPEVPESSFLK